MTHRVTIVGIGALGSHLVSFLRNEPVHLTVIDHDRVEMKNVASQFHFKGGVGKKKVEALKQAMQFCYGGHLNCIGNKLIETNVNQLLQNTDVIIDCLDNGPSRRLVQTYAQEHNIPCLHGALSADGDFAKVCWTETFVIDDAVPGTPTCENGEFLPFIAMTSAYLAHSVQKFLRSGRKVNYVITPAGAERV